MAYILVVDDDASVRKAYRLVLQEAGHVVSEAANGLNALDLLRMHLHPMVVVLDMMMPILSGLDLLETIAHEPALQRDYAYLVATAAGTRSSPHSTAVCSHLQVDSMRKPVDIEALVSAVAAAAERLPLSRQAKTQRAFA